MDPRAYLSAYLERRYLAAHPDLTPAARALVHDDIAARPEKYASEPHAQALLAYMQTHERLCARMATMDDLPDDEFERKRAQLFGEARIAFAHIAERDRLCADAQLCAILLAEVPLDSALADLLKLEETLRSHLTVNVVGFDLEAPHYWEPASLRELGLDAAQRTASEPEVVGWLHTVEALSSLCLASARYRAALSYARMVHAAAGYPNHAEGTMLLALARLEDEEGFFSFVHELEASPLAPGDLAVDDSPWYLLARAILLYKLDKRRAAQRALHDFAARCDGGAFFLLNPTYLDPYLPVRPAPVTSWDLTHQAVWDADGIIADTPDFAAWAEGVDGIFDSSESFAAHNGF
ncbi:hypothetical protein [Collinsella intestinalis]|uniref:hypothetical protein n=1 Tax=Collinsella intestinalis TaxID=147207 RepID=UPI00195B9822|nr:hypothetical protein [Collinsella intestinalis]MBM6943259.1 hypothetical protein [Collinsella intestinalis]